MSWATPLAPSGVVKPLSESGRTNRPRYQITMTKKDHGHTRARVRQIADMLLNIPAIPARRPNGMGVKPPPTRRTRTARISRSQPRHFLWMKKARQAAGK